MGCDAFHVRLNSSHDAASFGDENRQLGMVLGHWTTPASEAELLQQTASHRRVQVRDLSGRNTRVHVQTHY